MRRFEILVSRKPGSGTGAGTKRLVLGRFGSMVATVVWALLAVGLTTAALILGYLVAGLLLAVLFLVVLVAMVRGAFRALPR